MIMAHMIKWQLQGGSTYWVRSDTTMRNIHLICNFLEYQVQESIKQEKTKPKFNYTQISKATLIDSRAVRHACMLMSQRKKPIVRIIAGTIRTNNGVKTHHKVELIDIIETTHSEKN